MLNTHRTHTQNPSLVNNKWTFNENSNWNKQSLEAKPCVCFHRCYVRATDRILLQAHAIANIFYLYNVEDRQNDRHRA